MPLQVTEGVHFRKIVARSKGIERNQQKSEEIERNRRTSKETERNQRISKEIERNRKKSEEIKGNRRKSKAIERNRRKSKEIEGNQRKSNEIKRNQKKKSMNMDAHSVEITLKIIQSVWNICKPKETRLFLFLVIMIASSSHGGCALSQNCS